MKYIGTCKYSVDLLQPPHHTSSSYRTTIEIPLAVVSIRPIDLSMALPLPQCRKGGGEPGINSHMIAVGVSGGRVPTLLYTL